MFQNYKFTAADRFLRYVQIDTQSDPQSSSYPTTEKQKDLSTSKFVGDKVVKELNYEITVRNGKKEAIDITLEDQVPVSKNDDIKIRFFYFLYNYSFIGF